ncbi:Serine/threonine-protein phosphatase 5 [Apostasia shenzhenica]|uniref:Serine/threonine-protein phosphatase 5 n=1 Tax=Apostasia shenzhenica TaxID=1088818 RepID=A0A2I0A5D2_9ASPA|nr:Serine/threonine-protein phosphatase 5 [Apostasia shenzhenica]
MDKIPPDCPYPGCFFCVMKEANQSKRRTSILKFFRDLPSQDDDGQVLPISGLWNTAMSHPNDPEFINLGIFECMAALITKGLKNRRWLSNDQNIYIPYYAAHIIGSYTMNMEEFAERAVQAGVIPPLVELLRGRLTWVEQRVALRALGHLATYPSTFPAVASHGEVLELAMQLAISSLEIVYTHFYQFVDRRLSYHCDLLTRGMGGVEMESRKAEEWASQLQCWSLQFINCFAFKAEFLPDICKPEFLLKLPGMWGGLVNESSPAGIGLLRTICQNKLGRAAVASFPVTIDAICNIARSSDDWQYMAIDCLLWLLQDSSTRSKVIDKAAPALIDLAEISTLGDHKKLGETIANTLQECVESLGMMRNSTINHTREHIEELLESRQRLKSEKKMSKEDLHIKQAAALVVKLEGNSLFSSGNISGAASKYTEALTLCPMRSKKERVVLYSNRAQCHLLLQQPIAAISDSTRALCLHNPPNRHAKSLWRRAQAYDILGLEKESLLDAILFINECSHSNDPDLSLRQNRVPDYAEKLVKKQMRAAWLFREAAMKHGGSLSEGNIGNPETDDSEWETASDSDIGNGARRVDDDEGGGKEEEEEEDVNDLRKWKTDKEIRRKYYKSSIKGKNLLKTLNRVVFSASPLRSALFHLHLLPFSLHASLFRLPVILSPFINGGNRSSYSLTPFR